MTDEEILQKIGALAVKAHRARVAKDEAREHRGSFWCYREGDCEEPHVANWGAEDAPCWKQEVRNQYDVAPLPEDRWCERCLERKDAHLQYLSASSRLGALRGALTRACDRFIAGG